MQYLLSNLVQKIMLSAKMKKNKYECLTKLDSDSAVVLFVLLGNPAQITNCWRILDVPEII